MPDAPAPITVEEHLERILAAVRPLPAYQQPLMESLGLAAAESVVSPIALPPFDNSAMDGYAVHRADVVGAGPDDPVELPVVGEIGAGNARLLALSPGTAAKIMTGAPMPAGADAVVPYEWTDRGVARVRIDKAPGEGQHVRCSGEDVSVGDLLIDEGTVLGPRHLGLLASVGRATIAVRPRPRVVILSTGTELREPGTQLGHDSIYDGNSYLLAAAARRAGALAYRVGIVPDQPRAFLDALEDQLVRADVVVTSGGISMGDYDVVKEALAPLGTVWFGPVAMQPGKPQGFGTVGEDDTLIFTLPGNPVSSYLSFELFVLPALRAMMGLSPLSRPTVPMRLTHAITSPPGRRQFLRATTEPGHGRISPVGGPGSHLVGDLAEADALVVVPEDVTRLPAGAEVGVIHLDSGLEGGH
ncbi:gephyrin-like molybdotransferase Glp [Nocardioides cremeus]|jgi:molybdopterin molybdotransferase|uniref:Molybdopterin molybdenumtransferase n=1 Tax=Nocardioides cremeus TaxID=3058044 RepID=A0ABT8TKY2_9ACTN|nr:gephyrin-like molybdotransferase Glp [Nocardioides cremeus]MDO3394627.1 molybdopterin molybdotransferase MoeA [Nocardioides cremeus]